MTNCEGMPRHEVADHPSGKRRLPLAIKALAMAICISAFSAKAAEHMESTPQEVFDAMRGSFQPAKAKGVHARYQWNLSGPQGGQWWIAVDDGKYKMGKGKIENPSVIFAAKD